MVTSGVSPALQWGNDEQRALGVVERPFTVARAGDTIPGILWTPEEIASPRPLVLVGHGGQSEKRNPAGLAFARRMVRRNGFAVAAIDAPGHGERQAVDEAGYAELWKDGGIFDRMAADWSAVLDALVTLDDIDGERVAYWGLSMGTMLGVPFVASEPRVKAAVLGLAGLAGPSAVRGRFGERHRLDAPRITCPVQFFVMWDDERFDREGAFELFDCLGSKDKRLVAYPGLHGAFPEEGSAASREFLAGRLKER